MNKPINILALVGFTVIFVICAAAGLEVLTRLFGGLPEHMLEITDSNASYTYHPWAAHRMTPGFRFKLMSVNKYGWRGPELPREKPAGVKRVILLGDSAAYSSMHISDQATIAGYLQEILSEKTGRPWEVMNMAVPGGNSSVSLATLAFEGVHFQPDFVVVLNGNNDLGALTGRGGFREPFPNVRWCRVHSVMQKLFDPRTGQGAFWTNLSVMLNRSAFYRKFFAGNKKVKRWPEEIKDPDRLDFFVDTQLSAYYISRGAGAEYIHFLQPYLSLENKALNGTDKKAIRRVTKKDGGPGRLEFLDMAYPVLRQKLEEVSGENGFRSVDLSLMFVDSEDDVFADHVHMRQASEYDSPGDRRIAERMADEILRAGDGASRPGKKISL